MHFVPKDPMTAQICALPLLIPQFYFLSFLTQTTNSISFLFSLFGTGMVIKRFGLTTTLIAFPALMLVCTVLVWTMPNIWVRGHT